MTRVSQLCVGMLVLLFVFATRAGNTFAEPTAADRPNVLFLLADDLGWGDLSCYGNRKFRTPNLDRLAREGIIFTQYYQAGSVCSPTRAALMTGRYPAELAIHGHLATPEQNAARDMPNFLNPQVPTLPQLLKKAGYTTIHVGKWHLGEPSPETEGLQTYGFDVARWIDCREGDRNLWNIQERPVASRELVDATIQALKEVKDRSFYCQLWFNDPHALLAPSVEQMAPLRRQVPEGFTSPFMVYAATVMEMDRQIGRLLNALDELGLRENTLVIFSSDNGPEDIDIANASWSAYGSAGPLRGRKRSLYEGGIRVPFIVRWPAGTPSGLVNNDTVICGVDFLPTICELAGVALPEDVKATCRGESMVSAIRGDRTAQRRTTLFWEWRFRIANHPWNRSPILAVREGPYKLLFNPDGSRVELYEIPKDSGEYNNIAEKKPEIVKQLMEKGLAWQKTLPPGRFDKDAGQADYPWPTE
ncbi:MAG TPA: sulfatase-like hydrolase/transferase [Thermogutta sp.]|nr:sulfatase-like hydrolase/transferase [Thermogutta sp.]